MKNILEILDSNSVQESNSVLIGRLLTAQEIELVFGGDNGSCTSSDRGYSMTGGSFDQSGGQFNQSGGTYKMSCS